MAEIIQPSPTHIKRQCFSCSDNADLFAIGEYPQISAIATQPSLARALYRELVIYGFS